MSLITVLIKKRLLKERCQNLSKNINTFKGSLNMLFINKVLNKFFILYNIKNYFRVSLKLYRVL